MKRTQRSHPLSRRAPALRAAAASLLAAAAAGPSAAESISGVCPDGSIFIVQTPSAIPCSEARRVEPGRVPPIRPEYLPRPYAWQLFQERQNPNNPYNLVEAGRAEAAAPRAPEPAGAAASGAATAQPTAAAAQVAAVAPANPAAAPAPRPPVAPADLGLSNDEIRDLVAIIELSQERAPALLAEPNAGRPGLVLRLARSAAFEGRLRDAWAASGLPAAGHVVLFAAEARSAVDFFANLTFAQGHIAFHPDPSDPQQIGVLRGRQGALAAGEITLGYVVLPEQADLAQPIDIYWNDRRITATLAPAS
jgi:hypothetical protein